MAITKPITTGYPDLTIVEKNTNVNLNLLKNYEYLYTDEFTLQAGEIYFTEALNDSIDTALFLWSDGLLVANGKNKVSYTNPTQAEITVQLIVKKWSSSNENGLVLPSGTYGMWKGDTAYSDGETEIVYPFLVVNSRFYATNIAGDAQAFDEYAFGEYIEVNQNEIYIGSNYSLAKYTTEGIFVAKVLLDPDAEQYITSGSGQFQNSGYEYGISAISFGLDNDGAGYIAVGQRNMWSGVNTNSGRVTVFYPDLTVCQVIENPNTIGSPATDVFGTSLAISDKGLLLVSAPAEDNEVGSGSGIVTYNSTLTVYSFDAKTGAQIGLYNGIVVSEGYNTLLVSRGTPDANGTALVGSTNSKKLTKFDGLLNNPVSISTQFKDYLIATDDSSLVGFYNGDGISTERFSFFDGAGATIWDGPEVFGALSEYGSDFAVCGDINDGYTIYEFLQKDEIGSGSGSGIDPNIGTGPTQSGTLLDVNKYVIRKNSDFSIVAEIPHPPLITGEWNTTVSIEGNETDGAKILLGFYGSHSDGDANPDGHWDGEAFLLFMSNTGVVDTTIMQNTNSSSIAGSGPT